MEENAFADRAERLVRALWHACFTPLNSPAAEDALDALDAPDIDSVALAAGELDFRTAGRDAMAAGCRGYWRREAVELADERYAVQMVSAGVCVVYGGFQIREQPGMKRIAFGLDVRFSAVAKLQDGAVRLRHIHCTELNRAAAPCRSCLTRRRDDCRSCRCLLRDPLTGLCSRRCIEEKVDWYLRRPAAAGALFMIDVDDFKRVNDTLGHLAGDAVLVAAAGLLERVFAADEWIVRMGGDEFIVFSETAADKKTAGAQAGRLVTLLNRPIPTAAGLCRVSVSVGVALTAGRDAADSFNCLFHRADQAMYQAKRSGKNCYFFYESP